MVQDVQSAWLLHLHCAAARANYQVRSVHPDAVEWYSRFHDENIWQCFGRVLHEDLGLCSDESRQTATLPLILGRIGLRSADRLRVPACWCLPMTQNRHPDVAGQLIAQLEGRPDTPVMSAASDAADQLNGVRDFVPPSWRALADGARPQNRDIDDFERGNSDGWQHEVASRTDEVFRERMFASMADNVVAAVRSQGGSGAGLAHSCCPTCRITRLEAQLFRVTLLHSSCPFPSLSVPAGVASHSTLWATTEQRAQGLGFWARGDGLSRASQLASAVREAVVSQPTCRCVILIWPSQEQLLMAGGSRSLWMASRCSEVLSLLWTPPSSVL